ncbi:MAG: hypothetical protein KGJ80_00030 [Chloroflexota bacterium]|nr:hypothetical protein [Chloroflexota bacterium]
MFFLFSALLALALLALPAPRAAAQAAQGKIEGQIVNGTKDTQPTTTAGLSVTLYIADMTATTVTTKTAQSDANGQFTFANIDVISTTRFLATTTYNGVDYASDVLQFNGVQATIPVSVTIYETTTDPAVLKVAQTHFVVDVQTDVLNVLEVIQVTNTSDRSFLGSDAIGPHRVSLQLPMLAGATGIQFENQDADATTIRGSTVLSYTLPFQPGNDQIVFNYSVPFTPPTYQFNVALPFDTGKFRLLLADVGATITSTQLSAPSSFPTQSGQNFLLASADNLATGTQVKATIQNLPAIVNAPATPPASNPSVAPAATFTDNTSVLIGIAVLGAATIAAIALLAYPLLRRRTARAVVEPVTASGRRQTLLQSIADLDDDFEAGKVSESTYKEERERLKSKLVELGDAE